MTPEIGPDCLSMAQLEALLDNSSPSPAREHVESCARCKTELALLKEFVEGEPAPQERAAVAEIAERLKKQGAGLVPQPTNWWSWLFANPIRVAVPALGAVLLAAVLLRNPSGTPAQLRPVLIDDTVRSARLDGVSPVGDITKAPQELSWQPVANAGSYRIRLQDIEQKTIWEGSSVVPSVPLPREAQAQMMNRKTLYWQVDALDAARKPLASSGPQQFRVVSAQ